MSSRALHKTKRHKPSLDDLLDYAGAESEDNGQDNAPQVGDLAAGPKLSPASSSTTDAGLSGVSTQASRDVQAPLPLEPAPACVGRRKRKRDAGEARAAAQQAQALVPPSPNTRLAAYIMSALAAGTTPYTPAPVGRAEAQGCASAAAGEAVGEALGEAVGEAEGGARPAKKRRLEFAS